MKDELSKDSIGFVCDCCKQIFPKTATRHNFEGSHVCDDCYEKLCAEKMREANELHAKEKKAAKGAKTKTAIRLILALLVLAALTVVGFFIHKLYGTIAGAVLGMAAFSLINGSAIDYKMWGNGMDFVTDADTIAGLIFGAIFMALALTIMTVVISPVTFVVSLIRSIVDLARR